MSEELLRRITFDPAVMGGKACIRGMRVTVGMILGQLEGGRTREQILADFPYIEEDDIRAALAFAIEAIQDRRAPGSDDPSTRLEPG